MRLVRLVAITLLVCVAAAGDAPAVGEPADAGPWAARAEDWQHARAVIGGANPIHVMRFYTPEASFEDHTGLTHGAGRTDIPSYMWCVTRGSPPVVNGLYLSTDGVVLAYGYTEYGVTHGLLEINEVSAAGITASRMTQVAYETPTIHPAFERLERIEAAVHNHAQFWSGDDVRSPYAEDAVIEDSLLGVHAVAVDLDAAALSDLHLPGARIVGPATTRDTPMSVALADEDDATDHVYTVIVSDDGSGCPGSVVVALEWRDGLIVHETRYHEVSSARRCLADEHLPPGWWDEVKIPESSDPQLTGSITRPETEIAVFDAPESWVRPIAWLIDRFAEAGLARPRVRSVTVTMTDDRCGHDVIGHASRGGDVTICVTPYHITGNFVEDELMLHEFAHVWIDEHLDDATRDRFMAHVGAVAWTGSDIPWHQRGVELAANAIMYGLMDEADEFVIMDPSYDHTDVCHDRTVNFRLLTGHEPIAPCPQPPSE